MAKDLDAAIARRNDAVPDWDFAVERVHVDDLSVDDFVDRFMGPNMPVLVQDVTREWPARCAWTREDDGCLVPDPAGMLAWLDSVDPSLADEPCSVVDCLQPYFNDHVRSESTVRAFLEKKGGDTAASYLKDLHLAEAVERRGGPPFYTKPAVFGDDWLEQSGDDFRFVYLGNRGSWTPLHADVYASYSWSVNVAGRKRWWLFPPSETDALKGADGQLMFDVRTCATLPRHVVIEQGAGEALFVPSNWHHQVENLEATLSINHNWLNAFNVVDAWHRLRDNFAQARAEMDAFGSNPDADEMQLLLRAYAGMDFHGFRRLLSWVIDTRPSDADAAYGEWTRERARAVRAQVDAALAE